MTQRACADAGGVVCFFSRWRSVVLTKSSFAVTSGYVTSDETLCGRMLDEQMRRQLSSGGRATNTSSKQAALEPSCLAALGQKSRSYAVHRSREFLLRIQNPNRSWPALAGDDRDGSWVTSLAMIALRDCAPGISARLRGLHWLLKFAGKESNWFWKWKFRTTDRHIRFDPRKYGWPWFPETVSWVVPTSFAILALNQVPCTYSELRHIRYRVGLGIEMLIDRACPKGGWNAGNGVVYGIPLSPHVDDTAVALLALCERRQDPLVQSGVQWLERTVQGLGSPWSLASAVLALAADRKPTHSTAVCLGSAADLSRLDDTSTLALICLALDSYNTLSAFGVAI